MGLRIAMKLFSLALLSFVATAQDVVAGEPDERGKYNPGNTECGGVAIKDKMNGDDELNFLYKSSWSTMCRVKCGGNAKGRNGQTPRKMFCVKQDDGYGAVKVFWGNKKATKFDVSKFGCSGGSKYGSSGKDKGDKDKNKYGDKDKDKYNGDKDKEKNKYKDDKDKNKYPSPTKKPYQPPKTTKKPYQPPKTTKNPYQPPKTPKKPYQPPKPTKK